LVFREGPPARSFIEVPQEDRKKLRDVKGFMISFKEDSGQLLITNQ